MHRRSLLTLATASLLAGPALAAEPPPSGEHPIVIGQSYAVPSAILGETRRLNVWLPPSYGQGEQRYPVIYLLDGGEEEDFHHITGLARISGEYGVTREFIVVGIESGATRRYDMTFPSAQPDDLKAIPRNGGAARFRRFVVEEARGWVEGRYRTSGERVIMGESLAGLFVVETLLKQPDAFDGYIAIDPSLWWDKGSLAHDQSFPALKLHASQRRLFMAVSSQGSLEEGGLLAESLRNAIDLTYVVMPAETHASIYHPAATQAFRVMFAPPPAPPAH